MNKDIQPVESVIPEAPIAIANRAPTVIGGYRLIRRIGSGRTGAVFEAEQVALQRTVALKILPVHIAIDPEIKTRFFREAKAAGGLNHPNIVYTYEAGEDQGYLFLAMELLRGGDLDVRIRKLGALLPDQAVAIISDVAQGCATLHAAGLVHRDIKPANIFLMPNGTAKLGDLGLVLGTDEAAGLTATGAVLGTPAYMAPEQARGEVTNARSDIYALGATLYAALVGRPPFTGLNALAVMHRVVNDPVPDPRLAVDDLSPDIALAVMTAMAKDPAHRFANVLSFLAALEGRGAIVFSSSTLIASQEKSTTSTSATSLSRRSHWKYIIISTILCAFFLSLCIVFIGLQSRPRSTIRTPASHTSYTPPARELRRAPVQNRTNTPVQVKNTSAVPAIKDDRDLTHFRASVPTASTTLVLQALQDALTQPPTKMSGIIRQNMTLGGLVIIEPQAVLQGGVSIMLMPGTVVLNTSDLRLPVTTSFGLPIISISRNNEHARGKTEEVWDNIIFIGDTEIGSWDAPNFRNCLFIGKVHHGGWARKRPGMFHQCAFYHIQVPRVTCVAYGIECVYDECSLDLRHRNTVTADTPIGATFLGGSLYADIAEALYDDSSRPQSPTLHVKPIWYDPTLAPTIINLVRPLCVTYNIPLD